MSKEKWQPPDDLRREAQERLADGAATELSVTSEIDAEVLLHQLRVQQIELELQNEELRRVNAELDQALKQYSDFFEFAPVGYFILDETSTILNVNLAGALLLQTDRSELIGVSFHRFVDTTSFPTFHAFCRSVVATGEKQSCEVRLGRDAGDVIYALLEAVLAEGPGGLIHCRMSALNITDRKLAQEALQRTHDELEDKVQERTRELAEAVDALRASERRYSALFANKTNAIAHCRTITDEKGNPIDYEITEVNEAYEVVIGIKKADIEGRQATDVFSGIESYSFDHIGNYGRIALEGGEMKVEVFFEPLQKWFSIYVYSPNRGEFVTILTDITAEKIAEENKLQFYRQTILAATSGKLTVAEPTEIERLVGPPIAEWEIKTPDDLTSVRMEAVDIAAAEGMDRDGMNRLATCIGEAANNAFKHAGGGKASLHRTDDSIVFKIEDKGPGIRAMNIPDIAFVPGYSTTGTLGMGYKMIMFAADRVYLATGLDGTTVACELRLSHAPAYA